MASAGLIAPKLNTTGGMGGMQSPLNTMNQTRDSFNALTPTGLKGKLASLEDFISMQNEELAAQRQEIESLRNDKQNIEQHYQAQLQELKKTMVADVQRMQEEVREPSCHYNAERSSVCGQRQHEQLTMP